MDINQIDLSNVENSIELSLKALMTVFENNDFDKVILLAKPYVDHSLYHSSLVSKISMLKAGLTLDKDDLSESMKSVAQTIELCNRLRRKKLFGSLSNKFRKNACDKYTDIELHAELTYAMIIGCRAVLSLIQCHNLKKLVKIVYQISVCMNSFKQCRIIFEKRTKWQSLTSKAHFEAGVSLERGFRHLVVSFLPPKLLRIINFLGYRGVRNIAFAELNKTAFELPGIYSIISELVLIGYWIYIETHGCFGPKNVTFFEKLIEKKLEVYPNSLLYRAAKAKLIQLNGDIDLAIDYYNKIIDLDKEMFHKAAHWELLWCFAVKCDWDQCIRYAKLLNEHTLHSPAITTYFDAVFRYVKGVEDNDERLKEEATDLFERVPSLRIRYLGKTMTFEKAVVVFSMRYFRNNKFILLPVMEMLYQVNYICILNGNNELLEKWMKRINTEIENYSKDFVLGLNYDNYLTALFYKGIIYKHMGKIIEAQQYFTAVLNQESRIDKEYSLLPQSLLELGLIEMNLQNRDKAKAILDKVIKNYTKYTTENLVHIRVYAAFREMGFNTDKDNDNLYQIEEEVESDFNHNEEKFMNIE